jgi:DNA-binding NarL/FixJ family response regulator
MVQAQSPDLVIIDRSMQGRHRIALVELICTWDTNAKRAEEHKTARYADLKIALSNEGWDCSLYLIEVGARGHIIKSVMTAFGHYSGLASLRAIDQVLGR